MLPWIGRISGLNISLNTTSISLQHCPSYHDGIQGMNNHPSEFTGECTILADLVLSYLDQD